MDLTDPGVSLLLTDGQRIRQLNRQWRDVDSSTDVLSFPVHSPDALPDEPDHLGDIAISISDAERLAESKTHRARVAEELDVDPDSLQWTLSDEVSFLFVHGLLHLLGYDHARPEQESKMRAMEQRLWQLLRD